MEINEFKDRLFGRSFTRRALHRAMASFGVFSMAIPLSPSRTQEWMTRAERDLERS